MQHYYAATGGIPDALLLSCRPIHLAIRTGPSAQPLITTPMPDGPGFPRHPPSTYATSSDITAPGVPHVSHLLRDVGSTPYIARCAHLSKSSRRLFAPDPKMLSGCNLMNVRSRTCKFCDARADSREHVIPNWILQEIKISEDIRRVVGSSAPVWFKNIQNLKVRSVCKPCNNNWMSMLETDCKPTLSPLLNGVGMPLSADRQSTLARWAVKTSMVFESAAPPPPGMKYFYAKSECETLRRALALPPRTHIWLARFSGTNSIWGSGTHIGGIHVWHDRADNCKVHGYITTIVLKHLALQVLSVHVDPEIGAADIEIPVLEGPCNWNDLTVQISPSQRTIAWPPNRSFTTSGPFSIAAFIERFKTGQKR